MKKRKKSFRTIAVRVIALALCMWLCIIEVMTWAVSEDMFRQVKSTAIDWARRGYPNRVTGEEELDALPGSMERAMISGLWQPYLALDIDRLFPFVLPQRPSSYSDDDWIWGKWDLLFGYDFSVIYFDENGEPIMTSGNRMTFIYTDEDRWLAKEPTAQGIAWVDLDAIEGAAETMKAYMGDHYGYVMLAREFLPVVRLTGWFEGNEFHPTKLENGRYYGPDAFGLSLNEFQYSVLDKRGKVEWKTLVTAPAEPGRELVTVYGWDVDGFTGDCQKPVTVDGVEYENVTALRLARDDSFIGRGLWESVVSATVSREDAYGKYDYSLTVRCKPLQYAMLRLIPAYLVSGLLVAAAVWLILWRIKRNLTNPLETLAVVCANGWPLKPGAGWAEPYALEANYAETRQTLADVQAENTRLATALEYATNAEEKRKELISNITHELKTPLAIIHSYTEGLQSEIPAEKKEQYVQVILDETERMDGMVMQMLELSRLEAGRVKLSMEDFSLSSLICRVAERFRPLMEEKGLKLRLDLDGEVDMNGDEARMEQVITNYMSNAVKYSTVGGQIVVYALQGRTGLFFHITNNAPHLSQEGLEKVYDSFYREDAARTEKSTGLGLAIVKQIVSLHGMQCYVNNTILNDQPAVEFGFYPAD